MSDNVAGSQFLPENRAKERIKHLEKSIKELEERLEINPEHPYDGIYCRDETIRQLERQLAANEWQPIADVPRNSNKEILYGLFVESMIKKRFFEAYYLSEDEVGDLRDINGDYYSAWNFEDFIHFKYINPPKGQDDESTVN